MSWFRRTRASAASTGLPEREEGAAMVTVLGTVMVLTLLVGATLAFAGAGQRTARGGQDWNAALAAAEAGVDDYISRMNDQPDYWRYGDPAAPFSAGSTVVLPASTNPNPAFTGWTAVPGSDGRARFRYEVDNRSFIGSGAVTLQSTGLVGGRTRTVQVRIDRRSFLDYLYFTDYETKDPDAYVKAPTGPDAYTVTEAHANCVKRMYEGRKDRLNSDATGVPDPSGCTAIRFVSADRLEGPMHSNDAIYVCGQPVFTATATTGYDGSLTGGRRYAKHINSTCGTSEPNVGVGSPKDLAHAERLPMPPSNTALSQQVDPAFTSGQPGCLYTGPTRIVLKANGRMDVTSPWSANGGPAWCGTGTNLPLPARGVVWVRDVPATQDAYVAPLAGNPCPSGKNPVGYPILKDITPYGCTAGDVFINGALNGRLTVGAANNIVVVDDLTYSTAGCTSTPTCQSVLGLVANNSVEVYHPVECTSQVAGCDLDTATRDVVIEAAILAVNHSFQVQNYAAGADRGTLTVRGAIGQKYRGAVGNGAAGYAKNYVYDPRLQYASPPYFLDPVQVPYEVRAWSEQPPAHAPS